MAKKQDKNNAKGNGKGHGKQHAMVLGSVSDNIKSTEAARERIRKEAALREKRREVERADGTLYERVNGDRSNDLIAAIIRGEVGDYAFPGGDKPSLHFNVRKEIRTRDTVAAIRFETIQHGHELEGYTFDPNVWVNTADIVKHGSNFQSRSQVKLMKATQELIAHYLADKLEEAFVPEGADVKESRESAYLRLATSNLGGIADEVLGFYLLEEGEKKAVAEVFRAKYISLRIVYSEIDEIPVSGSYVPIDLLLSDEKLKQVTGDVVYAQQCAIHSFVRPRLLAWKEKVPAQSAAPLLTASGRPMGAKEAAKQERKAAEARAREIAAAREEADRIATLTAMRASAMSIATAAMSGRIGYVDLSGDHGDLIVQYRESGGDKIAEVAFIGDNHLLRLAGVEVGTKVFVGQIMAGKVDQNDYGVNKLSKEEVVAKTSLIGFIRGKLEAAHIRLPARTPANLKLAA